MALKRSLSFDNSWNHTKFQRTNTPVIIKAFDEVGQLGKTTRSMDDIFKVDYLLSVFAVLGQVEPQWEKQINNMAEIWDEGVKHIDHDALRSLFRNECDDMSLPWETYDLEQAYISAKHEWRIELMLAVVEKIIKWYIDDVPMEATGFAVWNATKQEIVIDRAIYKKC